MKRWCHWYHESTNSQPVFSEHSQLLCYSWDLEHEVSNKLLCTALPPIVFIQSTMTPLKFHIDIQSDICEARDTFSEATTMFGINSLNFVSVSYHECKVYLPTFGLFFCGRCREYMDCLGIVNYVSRRSIHHDLDHGSKAGSDSNTLTVNRRLS